MFECEDKGKHHAMQRREVPLGFMAALVQDKRAMQVFARMSEGEQDKILSRAQRARTRADMQLIVASLSDRVSATEYH